MDIGLSFGELLNSDAKTYKGLSAMGYKALDVCLTDIEHDYYTVPVDDMIGSAQNKRKVLAELGMYVNQVYGPWICPPNDATAAGREKLFNKLFRATLAARMTGAKYLTINPIMPFGTDNVPEEKALENRMMNKEFFRRVCNMAKNYNVVICLKNVGMNIPGMSRPSDIASLVREMNNDFLKMCLDTENAEFFADVNLAKEAYECADVIKTVIIRGCGEADNAKLGEFAKALKDGGYEGVFSFDLNGKAQEDYARYYDLAKRVTD